MADDPASLFYNGGNLSDLGPVFILKSALKLPFHVENLSALVVKDVCDPGESWREDGEEGIGPSGGKELALGKGVVGGLIGGFNHMVER